MMILSPSCILFFNAAFTAGLVGRWVRRQSGPNETILYFLWIRINVVTCWQLKFLVVCSRRELRLAECDA